MGKWRSIVANSILFLAPALCWAQQDQQQLRPANVHNGQDRSFPEFTWRQSLPIRSGDPGIGKIGGTEVRALAIFDGKLFAAIGYWKDTEQENLALPGAQVLRLDGVNSEWQIDFQLDERMPVGRR